MVEQLSLYVDEGVARRGKGGKRLAFYLGLAMLLAAASLVAVNSRGAGVASRFPRVLVPGSGSACNGTPGNGYLFSSTTDGVTFNVCISQEGNINQIQYPDTAAGHSQIAFDGYCLADYETLTQRKDYSPGSGVASSGWGSATLTQTALNIFSVVRDTTDGKFRLTEFIKVNIQPRSVFVGMAVKNLDSVAHQVLVLREVAPAIDGNAADDQYNEFGRTGSGIGATGQAYQGPTVGTNSLLIGATQSTAQVATAKVADFQAGGGCGNYFIEPPGYVTGGNRLFTALVPTATLAPNASANFGKFVYRML